MVHEFRCPEYKTLCRFIDQIRFLNKKCKKFKYILKMTWSRHEHSENAIIFVYFYTVKPGLSGLCAFRSTFFVEQCYASSAKADQKVTR